MAVLNKDVERGVQLLLNSFSRDVNISEEGLDAEREILHRRNIELQRDQLEQTFSSLFETTFRDHQMGLPIMGIRDNAANLTADQVNKQRDVSFIGSRVALVISGNPENPDKVLDNARKGLSSWPTESTVTGNDINPINLEMPLLTSSTIAVRDDEMANLNVAISYKAPAYGSSDDVFYRYFQKLVGNYDAHENGTSHLNSSDRQYNLAHTWLGETPGINMFRSEYMAYSDTGLYTSYVHGHEIWGTIMIYLGQFLNCEYTKTLNQADVYRGRARFFNDLLEESRVSIPNNVGIARDMLYTGRRIGRNEWATKVSALAEPKHVQNKAKKHFYDQDISVVFYGPQHLIDNATYYDRFMRKSTLHSQAVPMQMLNF